MMTIDSMFALAIELRDKGDLSDSVNVFTRILNEYPTDKKTYGIYLLLGGVYADLGENEKAFLSFKNALELNSKSELTSLGLYLTLVKLNRYVEAIHELLRYLKSYPAVSYKVTLKELLEDLKKGYMTNYEDDIRNFATLNGIRF